MPLWSVGTRWGAYRPIEAIEPVGGWTTKVSGSVMQDLWACVYSTGWM